MKKVTLRPLAVIDLSLRYARRMEGNKIIHYRVSMPTVISSLLNVPGASPLKEVQDYIRSQEGDDIEFEVIDHRRPKFDNKDGGALAVEDVSDKVLKNHPKILKELKKYKSDTLIHQFLRYENKFYQYKDLASYWINKNVIRYLNIAYNKLFNIPYTDFVYPIKSDREIRMMAEGPVKYLETLVKAQRTIVPVTYLAYMYEEVDEQKAFDALASDLKILSDNGLILGHLCMPSTLEMADNIGFGIPIKALFCYVVADTDRLMRHVLRKNPLEFPPGYKIYKDIGVMGEMYEGECANPISGFDPASKYEIETVYIDPVYEKNHQAVLDAYTDSLDHVNKVAKTVKEGLKNSTVESESCVTEPNKVMVNVKITKNSN